MLSYLKGSMQGARCCHTFSKLAHITSACSCVWFVPSMVSLEVFHCSPQHLKAGIVATALFRRFLEFSMYSHRCIIASTLVACSGAELLMREPTAQPMACV